MAAVVRELFAHTGPDDRLLDLADCELELLQISEGATDHVSGVSLDCNPHERDDAPRWQAWRRGWLDACRWRDLREASALEDWTDVNESQEDDDDAAHA
jgi:hypothetical protein